MAYAKPLEVYQELELANVVYKKTLNDGSSISSGATVDLGNTLIIKDGILASEDDEVSSDRNIKLYIDGSLIDPSNYDVDLRKGELDYNGSASGTAEATYFYSDANIPSQVVEQRLEAATSRVENETNTVFGGVATVTDEIYSGTGREEQTYILDKRPVQSVTTVEVNEAEITESDNWTTADSGGGNDYVVDSTVGISFIRGADPYPSDRKYALRVTYDYGHSTVPADIRRLTIYYAIAGSQKLQIMAANVKGRDNFDPETTGILDKPAKEIVNQYRVSRFSMADYELNQEGTIS